MTERTVVLVCGPPGAGKTTRARELAGTGLTVYDVDDAHWHSERSFIQALRAIGRDSAAQAVVIRAGATRSSRAKAASLIRATDIEVLTTPADVCIKRITSRKRTDQPIKAQIAGVRTWWSRYEPDDRYPQGAPSTFDGGSSFDPPPRDSSPLRRSTRKGRRRKQAPTGIRGYGAAHQRLRRRLAPIVAMGGVKCARCGEPIKPGEPWDLGHDDHDRRRYTGPEHARCNRATAGRRRRRSREW